MDARKFFEKHTLKCLAGGFVAGVLVMSAASFITEASGSPAFCGTCHAMKEAQATFAVSPHRNLECVDCHLPHDNAAIYWAEKGRTGLVDTYHETLRDYPANILLSSSGKETVNANCLRCHEATMSRVHDSPMDANTNCLKCHQGVAHGKNHLEGGVPVVE